MASPKIDKSLFKSILNNLFPEKAISERIDLKAFDAIDILVKQYFDENFCQLIISSIESEQDTKKIALIFDVLLWSTPDNGKKLDSLTKGWLESKDLVKIKSMLFRYEWLPDNLNWEKLSSQIITLDNELEEIVKYYTEELIHWNKTGLRRTNLLSDIIKNYS